MHCLCVDSHKVPTRARGAIRRLDLTSCGYDEARRHRASGAGFVSCASSPCSPCWCCSRGRRSHSVWFAPSRARSLFSTPRRSTPQVDGVIYASNGRSVLAVLRGEESRVLLKDIDDVSPIMRQAIVSVEDRRFYEHNGVDTRGIMRALWQDVRSQGVVEGGSTITQQFVKNAYVRNQRTIARKVREAALAWQLEQRWPKDRILLAYLNTIYFGNGAYGIQQAARTYFGKGARPPHARRVRAPRRAPGRPVALRPDPASARGQAAAALRAADDVRPGQDHARASCTTPRTRAAAEGRGRAAPGHPGPGPVLRQLRQGPADREVRRRARLRRRAQGDEHDRPRAAGDRAQGDRERPQDARRARRRTRRDRPAHGRRSRDGRRLELPREPVQPRHPGRAAARLVVQADRARNGTAAGHLADHDLRVEARRHRRRRPDLARHELRGRLPRPGRPRAAPWSSPTTPSTPS